METKNTTLRKRARDPPAAIQPRQSPHIDNPTQQTHFNEIVSKLFPREIGFTSRVYMFLIVDTCRVETRRFEVRLLCCLSVRRFV